MEENVLLKQIRNRHDSEISALRLQRQAAESESALRQAKFDLRTAQQEQVLYGGSLRCFFDRLKGQKEAKETALRHGVQKAEANLTAARGRKETVDKQITDVKQQLELSTGWDDLRLQAEGEALREWYRLDALYCIEAAQPLLEENRTALLEQRSQMNGGNAGKIYSYAEQAEVSSAPEKIAQRCAPYILRLESALEALELSFAPCTYFRNPSAFVNGVIAKHNRLDRINEAIGQVEAVQSQLPKLQRRLEAEAGRR